MAVIGNFKTISDNANTYGVDYSEIQQELDTLESSVNQSITQINQSNEEFQKEITEKVNAIKGNITTMPCFSQVFRLIKLGNAETITPRRSYIKLQGTTNCDNVDGESNLTLTCWDNWGNDDTAADWNNSNQLVLYNNSAQLASFTESAYGGHGNSLCYVKRNTQGSTANAAYLTQLYTLNSSGGTVKTSNVIVYNVTTSSIARIGMLDLSWLSTIWQSHGNAPSTFNLNSVEYVTDLNKFACFINNDGSSGALILVPAQLQTLGSYSILSPLNSDVIYIPLSYPLQTTSAAENLIQTCKYMGGGYFGVLRFKPNFIHVFRVDNSGEILDTSGMDIGMWGNSNYWIGEPQDMCLVGDKMRLYSYHVLNQNIVASRADIAEFSLFGQQPSTSSDSPKTSIYEPTVYVDASTSLIGAADGSSEYPFYSVDEAIKHVECPNNGISQTRIRLANGNYLMSYPQCTKEISIEPQTGASNVNLDITQCKGCTRIEFKNLTVTGNNRYADPSRENNFMLGIHDSDAKIYQCTLSPSSTRNALSLFHTTATVTECKGSGNTSMANVYASTGSDVKIVDAGEFTGLSNQSFTILSGSICFIDSSKTGNVNLGSSCLLFSNALGSKT